MKTLIYIMLILFISSNLYSAELIDCSKETNLVKKLSCNAKNIKSKFDNKTTNLKSDLNEKQDKTKEKISKTAKDLKSKIEN